MGQKGTDTSCLARIGMLGFIVPHRSSQDFTHCCTLRSEAREKPNNRAFSSKAKLFIEVSVCGCSSPSLALPRRLISCHAYCIASKHHDRLPTLSISLSSYSYDMLWIPLIEAPGSDGSRPQPHMLQAAHPALRALFPELVLARKVRRSGESEELQTSGVLALAETSDCHPSPTGRMCHTQAVQ